MQLAHERLCIDEVFLNLQPPFMEEHLQLRDQLNFWHAVRVYTFGACLVAARDHHTLEWDSNSREQVGDGRADTRLVDRKPTRGYSGVTRRRSGF